MSGGEALVRAFVVDDKGELVLTDCPRPVPAASEALVKVSAVSLNRGEVTRARAAKPGTRLGWDVAGVVEAAAADGSGPSEGARVAGLVSGRGWADRVAVPTSSLAPVPDGVTLAAAAALPVAGLTAYYALGRGKALLGRRVLITGASGGVGQFACRLAGLAGARVTGVVRAAADAELVRQAGADAVAVGEDGAEAAASGPYDLILESVGGSSLARSLTLLAAGGVCVVFGVSADAETQLDARAFFMAGSRTVSGLALFEEIQRAERPDRVLAVLLDLMARGRLRPPPTEIRPFTDLAAAARDLLQRRVRGKLILDLKN